MAEGSTDKEEPRQIDCVSEGAIAVLFKIAEELGIRKIVDQYCSKRQQGMSVGDYILIAALNRAVAATSKSKIAEWVDSTALHLYMPLQKEKLESQNFWDHFDKLDQEMIDKIGDNVARKAISLENIPLDTIVYDTTNYYNYFDVLTPSELSKIAKSKAGRNSLRHIGLALAVDRDHGIPLFSRLYPANEHDAKVMKKMIDEIFAQINAAMSDKKGITLVFDKGNNSEELILKLDEIRHHFVGSCSAYHHKDLCRIPLEQYREVSIKNGEALPVYETREEIYGAQRRVIVSFNESTFQRQLHRMERNLEKAKEELSSFKRKAKDADGRSTMDSMQRQALEITDRYQVTGLLDIDILALFMMTDVAFAGHPLVTDDTGTQSKGKGQVEIGMSYFYDKDKVDELTTLKSDGGDVGVGITIGVLDTVDVVVGLPYAWYSVKENDVRIEREDGVSDITFDVKWRFFEKDGWSTTIIVRLSRLAVYLMTYPKKSPSTRV